MKKSKYDLSRLSISLEEKRSIEAFLLELRMSEKAENTCQTYFQAIRKYFSNYCCISKENMISFKKREMERHKPSTVNLRLIAMNRYCDFSGRSDCKIKMIKIYGESSVENIPTRQEYEYFLSCLLNDGFIKMYWIIRFISCTGVRASELVRLKKMDIEAGEARMWTKGKMRKIIFPSSLVKESKKYFDSVKSDFLFPNRYGEMMKSQSISKLMSKYGERYNLRREILHPHAFRHLFAILFLESNGNLTLLSNLLGHESVKTTAIYLQLSDAQQREQLDKTVTW